MRLRIEPVEFADELFSEMLAEAAAPGGRFLLRMRDEWLGGTVRFEIDGEILLGAFVEDKLVGVGAISRDPYAPAPGLGRVRHVYVLEGFRRRGVGRALLNRLLAHGRDHFSVLRLSTRTPEAAQLYESLGFRRSEGFKETHRLDLQTSSTSLP
jgi:GNAT superfamily N-acetyltransferase